MRKFIGLALLALGALPHVAAFAANYPKQPVHIVVAYPAGSTMDNLARMLGSELQAKMGAPFIIDNKPGAAGQIGAEAVAKAKPDGYTLFISGSSTHSANPALFKHLRYDPVKDFAPVIHVASLSYVLVVNAESPAHSIKDLAKESQRPGGVSFGYGSQLGQIAAASISKTAGIKATGIPYKGQPEAVRDLIGGETQFIVADVPVLLPMIKSGQLRPLAVLTKKRSPLLPQVPTLAEQGVPNYGLEGWIGLSAPAGTPPDVVNAVADATAKVIEKPAMRAKLSAMGMEYEPGTPATFGRMVQEQLRIWAQKVKDAGLQPAD
jgi:tripartite-type tricarboxylate transporter receptor subunit TctC